MKHSVVIFIYDWYTLYKKNKMWLPAVYSVHEQYKDLHSEIHWENFDPFQYAWAVLASAWSGYQVTYISTL